MKICLWGYHSCRTPFAYQPYRRLLQPFFEYTDDANLADVIVAGYILTFKQQRDRLREVLKTNPKVKLVAVSEEPLWDTLWCQGLYENQIADYEIDEDFVVTVLQLNHATSKIYDFVKIPYFITTENKYLDMYLPMLRSIVKEGAARLKRRWQTAIFDFAFIAEYRDQENYEYKNDDSTVIGLNNFRTRLAQRFQGERTLIEGHGWQSKSKRQSLPDWHLDKLSKLSANSRCISAIENTHHKNYISEKLFDAYACGSVPLYYALDCHRVYDLLKFNTFVNVFNSGDVLEAVLAVDENDYISEVESLLSILTIENVEYERIRVSTDIINYFRESPLING